MSQTIWVMEQECCDECGWFLGYFGECTNPGCIVWEGWDKWDEEDDDNPYADSGDYDERAYLAGEYDDEDNMNDIPKPKDHITVRLEFKPNDMWIGLYTRKTDLFPWNYRRRWQRDIWICMLPMLPIHLWWTRTEHENNDLAHRHTA